MAIAEDNTKLGRIANCSLPPGVTCPGKTEFCSGLCTTVKKNGKPGKPRQRCYAQKSWKQYPDVRRSWAENMTPEFWPMLNQFLKRKPELFRIHVAGDFHSLPYILRWVQIAKTHPETTFLAFTRSWRIPALRRALEMLRAMPNVRLFASCDPETGEAPMGWRVAWMGERPGHFICPGSAREDATTCSDCKKCWGKVKRICFPIH